MFSMHNFLIGYFDFNGILLSLNKIQSSNYVSREFTSAKIINFVNLLFLRIANGNFALPYPGVSFVEKCQYSFIE